MKILIILLAITSHSLGLNVSETHLNSACQKWAKTHFKICNLYLLPSFKLAYVHFETFEQLNISCDLFIAQNITLLGLRPTNKHLLLDSNFDLRPLLGSFVFNQKSKTILIQDLRGFNMQPYLNEQPVEKKIDFVFLVECHFDFFLNSTRLVTPDLCVRSHFENSILNLALDLSLLKPYYATNVCPYVFMNSPLVHLTLDHISNSFIYKNQLEFLSINATEDLNVTNIYQLELYMAYENVTAKLINKNVFRNVVIVHLAGYFYGIQEDLFDLRFIMLKMISIQADNHELLFHRGIKWIEQLNRDLNQNLDTFSVDEAVNLDKAIYLLFDGRTERLELEKYDFKGLFKVTYTYPDKDFCLFKNFPHRQLVAPLLVDTKPIACTCTRVWLFQYAEAYQKYDAEHYEKVAADLLNDTF